MSNTFRNICSKEGYFDHYFYFTTLFKNYKEAYELTEKIHRSNFGHTMYVDYASFRVAKSKFKNYKPLKSFG